MCKYIYIYLLYTLYIFKIKCCDLKTQESQTTRTSITKVGGHRVRVHLWEGISCPIHSPLSFFSHRKWRFHEIPMYPCELLTILHSLHRVPIFLSSFRTFIGQLLSRHPPIIKESNVLSPIKRKSSLFSCSMHFNIPAGHYMATWVVLNCVPRSECSIRSYTNGLTNGSFLKATLQPLQDSFLCAARLRELTLVTKRCCHCLCETIKRSKRSLNIHWTGGSRCTGLFIQGGPKRSRFWRGAQHLGSFIVTRYFKVVQCSQWFKCAWQTLILSRR